VGRVSEEPNAAVRALNIKTQSHKDRIPFAEAFRFWLKLGFISFGGPTGQISIMHHELVEKRKWITENRFLHALNYCMFLPGPEAQQLAIYIGWLLHRTIGGIVAGALFVIPSIVILWALSFIYVAYGKVPAVASVFYGLKGAVIAIVAIAVLRIGKKALKNTLMWLIAALAFIAIFFLDVPFPIIIGVAGLGGFIGSKLWPRKFAVLTLHSGEPATSDNQPQLNAPPLSRALKVSLICVSLWWLPVVIAGETVGWHHTVVQEAIFFSKAAMLTFGGAYAVLPYVSQHAVEQYGWLSPGQMMDGLGLAETTPGPLIMVLQFVGFMGAWNQPQHLSPIISATLGALMTTWVTFVPCFLWIFLGAPYIERLRGNIALETTFSAITAAVVGVVLNLAVWFALHAVFPGARRVDWFLLLLAVVAFAGMYRWKWDIVPVVLVSGAAGLIYKSL
jgi:chromate transporter